MLSRVTCQVVVGCRLALFTAVDLTVASGSRGAGQGASPGEGSRGKICLLFVLSTSWCQRDRAQDTEREQDDLMGVEGLEGGGWMKGGGGDERQ